MAFDQIKYNNEYKKNNYDRITVLMPKGKKEQLQKYCISRGISVSGLINELINSLGLREE